VEDALVKVLMIAPPGAGKGTQGAVIAERFGVPHIATGEVLRDHVTRRTELGSTVQHLVERGELVPDEIVLEMVRQVLEEQRGDGYVLDGIPRTMAQARALYEIAVELDMTADVALHLQVEDDELVRRLLDRAAVEGRSDDTEEVISRRIALYHQVTRPILAWYRQRGILVTVDAAPPVDVVSREILTALDDLQRAMEAEGGMTARTADRTGLDAAFGASPQRSSTER
jgi:adenylate kinase